MPTPFVPTPTPNYITGQVIAVSVGGKLAYCLSGNADTEAKVIVRTNSRSGGFQEIRFGTRMASGQLLLAYNGDDPPTITEGTFATLIIDTVGYEFAENQENQTVTNGNATPTAPTGELITINAGITKVARSWNADSGDFSWTVTFTSSGAYQVATASGATSTT